jgi:arsenite methyltransferase
MPRRTALVAPHSSPTHPSALRRVGIICCDTTCRPDGLANMLLRLMQSYARDNALLDPDEVAEWAAEQRRLAEEGRFFFSLTHYVVSARKA